MSPSTSATREAPGNADPTRTPTDCCANTSRSVPRSRTTPRPTSTRSPPNSTTGLDKPSAGGHHHKHSTKRCDDHLRPPPFGVRVEVRDPSRTRARISSKEIVRPRSAGSSQGLRSGPGSGPCVAGSWGEETGRPASVLCGSWRSMAIDWARVCRNDWRARATASLAGSGA